MPRTAPAPNALVIPGMCPGVIVAGGGGAGGGAGAGAGNAGKKKSGADGENDSDQADGGKKGSGACGQGANGACSNCGHNVAAGDPVDVGSGKVFTVPKADLYLPGAFAVEMLRSYSSERRTRDVGLGFGWTHSFAWSLHRRRELHITTGDGRNVELPNPEAVGHAVHRGSWAVFRGEGYYMIRPGNEFVHFFEPTPGYPDHWRLVAVRYRNRGTVKLAYDARGLRHLVDTVGRTVHFGADGVGRITSVIATAVSGRQLVFARYRYDASGNLIEAADADGNRTQYAYDAESRLVKHVYPNGLTFNYVYDAQSRCIETFGIHDQPERLALADDVAKTLSDGTPAQGIYHCRLLHDEALTVVDDSIRSRRFEFGPDNVVAKAVDGRGGVTSRTFDERGLIAAVTDPTGSTWSYVYDEFGDVIEETDPEGFCVAIDRRAGRPVRVVDPAGGVFEITRDSVGELLGTFDQAGGSRRYERNEQGLVTQVIDERGGVHRLEYDDHANAVRYINPKGATSEFAYDDWGRQIAARDPSGGVTRFGYSASGRRSSLTDPLGRTTRYEYDVMGNLSAVLFPDASVTRAVYGGLNWLQSITYADGAVEKFRYNREGWLVEVENPLGAVYKLRHTADGQVESETDYTGHETRYGHDALGRVTWFETADGRTEAVHSRAGRVMEEHYPNGDVISYQYNARGDLTSAASRDVRYDWRLDPLGRILEESFTLEGGASYAVRSLRATDGSKEALTTSLGHALSMKRDQCGRVASVASSDSQVLRIERNPLGLITTRTLSHGGRMVDTYAPIALLTSRTVLPPLERNEGPGWSVPESTRATTFEYSSAKELTAVRRADGSALELEYDLRARLRRATSNGATANGATANGATANGATASSGELRYVSDANGNCSELDAYGRQRRTYDAGDRLRTRDQTQYEYDQRGRLVSKRVSTAAGEQETRYVWNSRSLLEKVELHSADVVTFKYDAFARRVEKRVERANGAAATYHYVWDQANLIHVVAVSADPSSTGPSSTGPSSTVPSSGVPSAAVVTTFGYLEENDTTPFAQRTSQGTQRGPWQYFVGSITETPEAIADGSGNIQHELRRSLFGEVAKGHELATLVRMPGQFADVETGLHYNRYRYYDPQVGSYISPDPLGLEAGLNLYAFGPNPISWIDPMGWTNTNFVRVTEVSPPPGAPPFQPTLNTPGAQNFFDASWRPCPPNMRGPNRSDAEQKISRDLIGQFGGGQAEGRHFRLEGMHPPCPNCHAAMMRAAKDTGATVTYDWGNGNSITYTGGSGTPQFAGEQGLALGAGGYSGATVRDDNAFQFDPNRRTSSAPDYWGVDPGSGSWDAYNQLMNPRRGV